MKTKIILLFATFFLMTLAVSAQNPEGFRKVEAQMELGRKKKAALDAIASISPALMSLRADAPDMIIEATKTKDPALIPHLKVLASDKKVRVIRGTAEFQAHIALAKLGEPSALPEIFSEVDSKVYLLRMGAVAKLARIGSKDAYRKLYALLDDLTVKDEIISADVLTLSNSRLVMEELSELYTDTPKKSNGIISYDTDAWKAWFKKTSS